MPLYEYQCPACDRIFEELRRAGDESPAVCPECGAKASRIVSLSAFALKGSGFYATDYVSRRPDSFQKDNKGTIKGTRVEVPQLARDPSVSRADEEDTDPAADGSDTPVSAKEGA